jgi:precorrin-2 dehydrogenase/sirohydrochlorin ferrochelatase
MSLFPLFLKLTGRRALVIGAGRLAESKIDYFAPPMPPLPSLLPRSPTESPNRQLPGS